MKALLLWFVVILAGCVTAPKQPGNPLLAVACPDLTPPVDDSFGATTRALLQVSGQYYACRRAALVGESSDQYNHINGLLLKE